MATQVTLGSGVVDSASGLKLRTNGTTEAVDISTGQVVTLAKDAVVNGLTVGKGAGAVSTNTAVGASALATNTTAAQSTAVGYQASYSDSTGGRNTTIGYQAGYAVTSESGASFAGGYQALKANTSGRYNIAIGGNSALSNTTASGNIAIGQSALETNTTGASNVAVGSYDGTTLPALYSNTTGSNNVAMGVGALKSNTTANDNTAVGYQALYSSNRTADVYARNTAVGYQAGYGVTTGNENVVIGRQAGYSLAGGSGSVFVGEEAGNVATGNNNCFVGYAAGSLVTTGAKNTILGRYNGNQGGLDIRTSSNNIVLSDGDGNPRGWWDGSNNFFLGKVAANTTEAGWWFESASGNGYARVNFVKATSSGTSATTAIAFYYNGGQVGTITSSSTATAYNTTSDYRLKNVIGAISDSGERIDALEPVEYEWKSDGTRTRGFLAHKFQEVYANSVSGTKDAIDENGNPVYQGMQAGSSEVIADLVAEIKSLRLRVAELENK